MTTDIPILIERLKEEIAFKAQWYGIPFDQEDIEAHELYDGHWVVALMWIKTPYIEEDERGHLIQTGPKSPNVGYRKPPPQLVQFKETDSPNVYEISAYAPALFIRNPSLVYLVYPDGSYKSGADDWICWFNEKAKEQVKEDLEWAIERTRDTFKRSGRVASQ